MGGEGIDRRRVKTEFRGMVTGGFIEEEGGQGSPPIGGYWEEMNLFKESCLKQRREKMRG